MGLGGVKRCGQGFKVIILRGGREGKERGRATKRGPVFMEGADPSIHHEGGPHNIILLF